MARLTVAVCTYNRAELLPDLLSALRGQACPMAFEILVVDNNSTDATSVVLRDLQNRAGTPLRVVPEMRQGITYARNRAIDESRESDFLAFIDDDELPGPGWLEAATDALEREGAECVGGEIRVPLLGVTRPRWLSDDLLGFLGEVRHGDSPFWIKDTSTPVWSGNVAYRTGLFDGGLRFDHRYNRVGQGIGGGSDAVMFRAVVAGGHRIRYRPDMWIEHLVEPWKLRRRYFLRLHFKAGRRHGRWRGDTYPRMIAGVPPFLVRRAAAQGARALALLGGGRPGAVRQGMNAAYSLGMVLGRIERWRAG